MVAMLSLNVQANVQETVKQLFSYIRAQGDNGYMGERVSQLEHALQCAHQARVSGADNETILAALLHDIGHFIPLYADMPAMIAPDGSELGRGSHDVFGEKYLRHLGFSDKICQLVGAHVLAKKYLTATDEQYYERLSDRSKQTLKIQGGPFSKEEVEAAKRDPLLQEKLNIRIWDDRAKVSGAPVEPLTDYEAMAAESLLKSRSHITLHHRSYALPRKPTVVVCVDGFDPTYLSAGISSGILPNLSNAISSGFHAPATSCMPSFTNPNNVSIVTGVPPTIHGIAGNFYLDPITKEERMVLDDTLLRGSTILQLMSARGVRVAAVTAKDKLRRILSHGLDPSRSICFSAEYANKASLEENGISNVEEYVGRPAPPQYSGDLSIYVLDAGIKLLQDDRAELFYLTLSDFIQHKHAPGSEEANDFMTTLDNRIGRLVDMGANVVITGDHGMSDKSKSDGSPNVLYVQDVLEDKWGKGCARVICPITDPFVKHHGALGGFVRVHVEDQRAVGEMIQLMKTQPEVEIALAAEEAASQLELPLDREGDFVVISVKGAALGSRKEEHDLTNLKGHRLRTHGGISEQDIPLIMTSPAKKEAYENKKQWRNYDAFDLALNYAA
ncbi:alkaline-phosphatase-like protein [Xylogone sp. PMI_703]|nr:alkaline-phosphatase-like protein [Xylogone sp. PMI_703]